MAKITSLESEVARTSKRRAQKNLSALQEEPPHASWFDLENLGTSTGEKLVSIMTRGFHQKPAHETHALH